MALSNSNDLTALENTSKRWTRYDWWSKYSSPAPKDEPAVEEIWDAILPAHGIVAVDHQWAAEKQLPASMSLPSDPQKGVYIIDAYHQIHCLVCSTRRIQTFCVSNQGQKIIRKTFYQVARNEPLTYPLGHSMHCFDSLRQYIMCTAGETLLYSWGRNITGDGQFRKCKDWGALRDWATQNAACYRDSTTPIPLYNHFGYCDNGTDGFVLEA